MDDIVSVGSFCPEEEDRPSGTKKRCIAILQNPKNVIKRDELVRYCHIQRYGDVQFFGRSQAGFPGWNFMFDGEWHRCNPPNREMIENMYEREESKIQLYNYSQRKKCRCHKCHRHL